MLKFTNNIEKENFQNNVEMWHTNVSVIEIETETGKKQKTWQIYVLCDASSVWAL